MDSPRTVLALWLLLSCSVLTVLIAEIHRGIQNGLGEQSSPARAAAAAAKGESEGGILLLMLAGGKHYEVRQKMVRRTYLDPKIDWGVNFAAFVFTNFEDHNQFKYNHGRARTMVGEVMHECSAAFRSGSNLNKCCLRARQLRFAAEYLDIWPAMDWVAFIDDDHYPVLPRLRELFSSAPKTPTIIGNPSCGGSTCAGFCGGAGIFVNRAALEVMAPYFREGLGKGNLETWMLEKCEVCHTWADLTTGELVAEINRQEYEKRLWLGPDSPIGQNVTMLIDHRDPPQEERAVRTEKVTDGLILLPTKEKARFEQLLASNATKLWHYDFRSRTHAIHQAMVRLAVSVHGRPPPQSIPKFKSMVEEQNAMRLRGAKGKAPLLPEDGGENEPDNEDTGEAAALDEIPVDG